MVKRRVYNRLKVVLAEKNKTNRELAKYLKVSETSVSKWTNNHIQPSLPVLFKIAEYLQVSPTHLIESEVKYIDDGN